jgi:hypothetical protein
MDGTGLIFAGIYFFIQPNWRNQAIGRVVKIDEVVKSQQNDGFVKSSRCKARKN